MTEVVIMEKMLQKFREIYPNVDIQFVIYMGRGFWWLSDGNRLYYVDTKLNSVGEVRAPSADDILRILDAAIDILEFLE
ncbi:hypothetical protein DRN86_03860 [Candidatus Geothermarchaeota archaeon]|nr:MAG: hypothetical protein DRN86_03860 [Candidatus Geothermarchaeota archaeon]